MTDILASLREKNPGIPFYSVQDQAFRPYGRVVDFDASGLIRAAEGVQPRTTQTLTLAVTSACSFTSTS